jgi:plastocyanin
MLTMTRLLIAVLWCALAAGAVAAQTPERTHTQTIERRMHIAPFGTSGSRYAYVPFDVPRGAVRVSVSYDYAREGGANTLDLGVFDSRADGPGVEVGPRGFRGWSGGRRAEFFISRDEAPAGVDVSFKITVETEEVGTRRAATLTRRTHSPSARRANAPGDAAARTPSPVQQSAGRVVRWWSGDLHMHTVHSDGDWTVPGLADAARDVGLDFIFITDHNTSSHHAEIARVTQDSQRPLVLRGEEITTYGGHTNAWGLPAGGWVDFRVQPGDASRMSEVAASAHRLGALISINHPFALCGGCAWSYGEGLKNFDAVEVWNGEWDATDESALKMWDEALQRGLRPTAVASSDSHRAQNPIGRPTTHVAAEALTQAALLDAVRRGLVYLTGEAARPFVSFEAERRGGGRTPRALPGDEIRLSGTGMVGFYVTVRDAPPDAIVSFISGGRAIRNVPVDSDDSPLVLEMLCRDDSYYRVEVRDRSGAMLALTNPIYVKVRARR